MNEDNVGSLERLGIQTETDIEQDILTPASVKSVRFRTAKPSGYSFREVDELMEMVVSSITNYAKKLNQRDLDVHTLGRELDLERTNFLNAQAELQKLQLSANFAAGQAKVEQDKEGEAILARISSLQEELGAANARVAELEDALATAAPAEDNSEVQEELESVRAQYLELHSRYTGDVEALQGELQSRDSRIGELENRQAELETEKDAALAAAAAVPATAGEISPEREQQLLSHIEQITQQYGELADMYTASTEELKALKENPASDDSEELEAAHARIAELETELAQRERAANESVALPDPNQTASAPAPTRAYSNLPPGVRPEDLEGSDLPAWNRPRN